MFRVRVRVAVPRGCGLRPRSAVAAATARPGGVPYGQLRIGVPGETWPGEKRHVSHDVGYVR